MKINGKKVVDPKRRITLVITPNDVGRGLVKNPNSCAAAKACVRQLGAISARVHATRTYIEFPEKVERYMTPASLRTEIVSFDRGYRFVPGIYHLAPLPPTQRGTRKQRATAPGVIRNKKKGTPGPNPNKGRRMPPKKTEGIRAHAGGWSLD